MEYRRYMIFAASFLFACLTATAYDANSDTKLNGTVIGSTYSYDNYGRQSTSANTCKNAFDGNSATYFAAWDKSMGWAGLDLGTAHVITRVGIMPRTNNDGPSKTLLGVFEGANRADFMDAVPLYLISDQPAARATTYYDVNVSRGFRYVRYVGPADARSTVAELEFYGHEGVGDDSKFYQVTQLPTVSIHVVNNGVPTQKGEDFSSNITITYDDGTRIQEYPILTRVRGNYSATHENKPYRIKFDDGKKHRMLKGSVEDESPAEAKKWTLISSYGDKTLLRNNIAFEVSRRVGMPFTPYCRSVDLLLNGEYRGCYQLTDHVSSNSKRINITEMDPDDIVGEALTGGYLIEMNGYADSDPVNFTSKHGNPVTVHEPDEDDIQPEQIQYIKDHFNKMEDAVFASNYTDPNKGYRALLDLDSFLKYFLSNEFSGNTDMLWQVYMYKERGDNRIYTGPVWDNDLALENDFNVYPGNERKDWTYTVRTAGKWDALVTRVLTDSYAMERLQSLWADLRDNETFTKDNIREYIESLREKTSESARLNFIRWPYLTQKLHCNPVVWGTWDAEMDNVVNYATGRVEWMDKKLNYDELEVVNDVCQIKTPRDLITFEKMVNGGATTIKARLLADIDMKEYQDRYVPAGNMENPFRGSFDGNTHVISNLNISNPSYTGIFGVVGDEAKISNLTIDTSCSFKGENYIGALVGRILGGAISISNVGNEADVTSTGNNAGGLVGGTDNAVVSITNSYNTGNINAQNYAAALVGGSNTGNITISNSYNAGNVTGSARGYEFTSGARITLEYAYDQYSSQATTVTREQVASGQLCYTLNQNTTANTFHQNLDNGKTPDAHPVLLKGHGFVYLDKGFYTNINPNGDKYRYYLLDISEIRGDNYLQFAEFDLLVNGEEVNEMTVYAGTQSNVRDESWPNTADNNTRTKFCSEFRDRAYFLFDAKSEMKISGYRIYTANDTQFYPVRNPISWKLYGSNTYLTNPDDDTWELIDERNGDYTMGATNYTPYDFAITWPSGIENVEHQEMHLNSGVYDLSGRRVADSLDAARRLPRGIYIVNGRKIVVK